MEIFNPAGRQIYQPIDSATVILLRAAGTGFEVFLMRRHRKQSFMGGAYVFPGGRLDEGDCEPGVLDCSDGFSGEAAVCALRAPGLKQETAAGLYLCVLRELFEEAGVVLADKDAAPVTDASAFEKYRSEIHDGKLTMTELAEREGIIFTPGKLLPWSHWITPEFEKKRFSTWFFLALLPEGQEPTHDQVELVDSVWLMPREAIDQHDRGGIVLMPPTLTTLTELAAFNSLDDVLAAARDRSLPVILPQGFKYDGGFGVILPNDPCYEIEQYRRPFVPGEVSRVVMRDGVWKAESGGS